MVDVTEPIIETAVETETTPAPSGEKETGATTPAPETGKPDDASGNADITALQKQIENLNKALTFERKKTKKSTQSRPFDTGGFGEGDEEVFSHPAVQELLLKNATYELKEGTKDILEQYPQVPKEVVKMILKNPRGWVNEGTRDVASALLDIEENLVQYLEENQPQTTTPAPEQKQVKVMGPNALQNNQRDIDAQVQRILATPPEEWTPEDDKIMAEYTKSR